MNKNLMPTKLRSGDEVIVIAGKDIGKKGTLREIVRDKNKAIVTGINMVKKHTKPTKENKGGIVPKESFIHQSNVKNLDKKIQKKGVAK